MKKRFLALIVCVCALCGSIVSAFGSASQDNALVSRSYLEGVYLQELQTLIAQRAASAAESNYSAALETLDALGQSYLDQLLPKGGEETEWLTAAEFTEQGGERDDVIILAEGAGLIWTSGSASFSGVLVDLTDGKEVTGGNLLESHRYVAVENTVVTVTSRTAHWSVEGEWKTTSDGIQLIELEFVDVPEDAWYYDAVGYVVEKKLFVGVSDTEFAPNATMTRGMLTTVLYRFYGSPEVVYSPIFSDVPDGKWYSTGTVWAGMNGVVNGMGDGTFAPLGDLSRQQIAVMLYNYANWLGYDTSARADLSTAPDGSKVASWAQGAMSWAAASGIIMGDSNGNLTPADPATRAQVAIMLQRFETWMLG